jgi:hypothetical protein
MIDIPGFVAMPETAVSGRLLSSYGSNGVQVPCVLAAHRLPTFGGLGSAVFIIGAVGPSDSSYPFWPLGGVLVGESSLQPVRAVDDNHYNFELDGAPIEFDDFDTDLEFEAAEDLIDATLRIAAPRLGLSPWDDDAAAPLVEECEGWDYFDDFMAIDVQVFPSE